MPAGRQALFGPSVALRRAAAAVNAAGPPARLPSPGALAGPFVEVLRATGEPGPFAGVEAEAPALAGVLAELHDVFAARHAASAAARLNAALAARTGPLRLVEEPGAAWHLHADPPGRELWSAWFGSSSLLALAVHFAEHGGPAWGVCAASGCGRVYVRSGPGRPRRTCSPGCATRLRQAELRARRRAEEGRGGRALPARRGAGDR